MVSPFNELVHNQSTTQHLSPVPFALPAYVHYHSMSSHKQMFLLNKIINLENKLLLVYAVASRIDLDLDLI